MIHIDDHHIAKLLDYSGLIDALTTAFRTSDEPPARAQYTINTDGVDFGHLLLMPAWQPGKKMGLIYLTNPVPSGYNVCD